LIEKKTRCETNKNGNFVEPKESWVERDGFTERGESKCAGGKGPTKIKKRSLVLVRTPLAQDRGREDRSTGVMA